MKAHIKCKYCHGTGEVLSQAFVGASFRKLREGREISLRTMAQRLDISASYLSDLELGRRQWHNSMAEAFREALTL